MAKKVFLCSISNIQSGDCGEDCGFCTQSAHHHTGIESFRFKPQEEVLQEARTVIGMGAGGFCLVTSGKSLDDSKLEYVSQLASLIKNEFPEIMLIACLGIAHKEPLKALKQSGVDVYNHNLETARSFYLKACTSMQWEERYATCENAKSVGLRLCSGGIFGLGESKEQRMELLKSLQELQPCSTPLNFYIPHPSLPIDQPVMGREEALDCIRLSRESLSETMLMIAGGREKVFGDDQQAIFEAGVDSIILGNYLTTQGRTPQDDLNMLEGMGLGVASRGEMEATHERI